MRTTILAVVLSLSVAIQLAKGFKNVHLTVVDAGLKEPDNSNEDQSEEHDDSGQNKKRDAPFYDQGRVEEEINQLRRSTPADNMYYVNWNNELTTTAASDNLMSGCHLQKDADVDLEFPYVDGLTGYFTSTTPRDLLKFASTSIHRNTLLRPEMTEVGCAVSRHSCTLFNMVTLKSQRAKKIVCIFAYRRVPSKELSVASGTSCSMCGTDAVWCDRGLCRGSTGMCSSTCSNCETVFGTNDCTCICYHGEVSKLRCRKKACKSSATRPICTTGSGHNESQTFSIWMICLIVSGILLIGLATSGAIWAGIRHRRIRQRRAQSQSNHSQNSNNYDFGPNFVSVMTPLPYDGNKPPPYATEKDEPDTQLAKYESLTGFEKKNDDLQVYDNPVMTTADR